MIKYIFFPETQELELEVDLADAFKDSKGMTEFVLNAGAEAQTAILSILARIYQTINYVCAKGKGIPEKDRNLVKRILIQTACQETTLELFDEFLKGIKSPY